MVVLFENSEWWSFWFYVIMWRQENCSVGDEPFNRWLAEKELFHSCYFSPDRMRKHISSNAGIASPRNSSAFVTDTETKTSQIAYTSRINHDILLTTFMCFEAENSSQCSLFRPYFGSGRIPFWSISWNCDAHETPKYNSWHSQWSMITPYSVLVDYDEYQVEL